MIPIPPIITILILLSATIITCFIVYLVFYLESKEKHLIEEIFVDLINNSNIINLITSNVDINLYLQREDGFYEFVDDMINQIIYRVTAILQDNKIHINKNLIEIAMLDILSEDEYKYIEMEIIKYYVDKKNGYDSYSVDEDIHSDNDSDNYFDLSSAINNIPN